MQKDKIFNKCIDLFLKEQPDSSASQFIKLIIDSHPQYRNYHTIFDDLCYKIGLGFYGVESIKKNYYIPVFKYYPDNILEEEPREEFLINKNYPISFKKVYTYLAKEIVYRLMRIKNINQILNNQI